MPRNKRIPAVVTTQTPEPLSSSSIEHEHIDTAMEDLSADTNERANDSHTTSDLSAAPTEITTTAVPTGTVNFQGVVPKKRSLADTGPSVAQEAVSSAKRTKSHVVTFKVEPSKLKALCDQLASVKITRTKSIQRKTVHARSAKTKAASIKLAKSKPAQSKTTHTKAAQSKAAVFGKASRSKPSARVLKEKAKLELEENQAKPKPSARPLLWADVWDTPIPKIFIIC